ncbi:hypothetical protein K8942_04200 [Candidatus Peribacteria bacterium]|nr:MAG: hypothetical protein K8942_04200 [Candidatus Peribacteria bacterium]
MENQSEAPWIEKDSVGEDVIYRHRGGMTEVDARYVITCASETGMDFNESLPERSPGDIQARLFIAITQAKAGAGKILSTQ